MLEKSLESSLACKETQPLNPKGNQLWIFTRKTDAKVEAPILWPLDAKSWLFGKDPDAGKDWRQKEKKAMRMRWLDSIIINGHELQQTPGESEGWQATCAAVLGVTKSWTWLSKWTTTNFSVRGGVGSSVYSFNWLWTKYSPLGSCCTYKGKSCSILKENNVWGQHYWERLLWLLMACQFVGFPHPSTSFFLSPWTQNWRKKYNLSPYI